MVFIYTKMKLQIIETTNKIIDSILVGYLIKQNRFYQTEEGETIRDFDIEKDDLNEIIIYLR